MKNTSFLQKNVSIWVGLFIIAVAALVILGGTFYYASNIALASYVVL